MAKNTNNRILLLVLVALLAIYGISRFTKKGKSKSSFKEHIVQVDSAKISKIIIRCKQENLEEIILERQGIGWTGKKGSVTSKVEPSSITSLLTQLSNIPVKRIAAQGPSKWESYEVTDSTANFVKIFSGNKMIADLIIGKFDYVEQPQSVTSYLREADNETVYAIDGLLSVNINRNFTSYRNRGFLELKPELVSSIQLNRPEGNIEVSRVSGNWQLNGSPVDSTNVGTYLKGISNQRGGFFADNFNNDNPLASLRVLGNNMEEILVTVYEGQEQNFVLHSSLNPENHFYSDSAGLFKKLFLDLEDLAR